VFCFFAVFFGIKATTSDGQPNYFLLA